MPKRRASHTDEPDKETLTSAQVNALLLIRKLHEATQAAYDAADSLDAAMGRFAGGVTVHYKRVVKEYDFQLSARVADVQATLDRAHESMERQLGEAEQRMQESLAKLLEADSPDALFGALAAAVAVAIAPDVRDKVVSAANRAISLKTFRAIVTDELSKAVKDAPSIVIQPGATSERQGTGLLLDLAVIDTGELSKAELSKLVEGKRRKQA